MGAYAYRLYDVQCSFSDGTTAEYMGLSHLDLLTVVETFDNLDVTRCTIEPSEGGNP